MKLVPIEKRTGLTREEFIENYLKPSRPVVFTDLAKGLAGGSEMDF
jgi:hypothetical protein